MFDRQASLNTPSIGSTGVGKFGEAIVGYFRLPV
jgi:hypothetical protein